MRIGIFASGAVGSYFGGRLALAGEEVTFIARGAHLNAILERGLRVESIKGDFTIYPARATDDPRQAGPVDYVLVAVKAWQMEEAAQAMRPMVGPETAVVPLSNGVEAPGQLAAALGGSHVLGGLCRISAFIAGPGLIRHVGIEPIVTFGELNRQSSRRAERLLQAFERAGVKANIPEDIQVAMWEKFIFIAAISGVGAVTRAPAGALRSVPETRDLLLQALWEIADVAWKRQVNLATDIADRTLAFIDDMQADVLASMQRDIMEGRPSELETQNGAVVRMGREIGVPTPANTFIYQSLLPQELKARGEIKF